jgi:hypothetical protein
MSHNAVNIQNEARSVNSETMGSGGHKRSTEVVVSTYMCLANYRDTIARV